MRDVRPDFPVTETVFKSPVTGEDLPLAYFDHGASTHAPTPVLDAHQRFLREAYANVHRGAHHLSVVSTEAYEDARWKVEGFLHARPGSEVVFTHNTTAALNCAAHLMAGRDGVTLVTKLEHHSNDLPHRQRGPVVHVDVDEKGQVDLADYEAKLAAHDVKLVAVSAASNVTGIMPPVGQMTDLAHAAGAKVLVDGAQALAHVPLDLANWGESSGPDLFAAPGHKAYAPMGSAFLLAPEALVDGADPYRPGGGTVTLVSTDRAAWTGGAERHEGGTPNVAGAVALGAALDYLVHVGMDAVREHELALLERLLSGLSKVDGVTVYGDAPVEERVGCVSFNVADVPHALVSTVLDHEHGIATRNGCFCAHPYLIDLLGLEREVEHFRAELEAGMSPNHPAFPGAVRATVGIYNTAGEVDRLVEAVAAIADGDWAGDYAFDEEAQVWRLEGSEVTPPLEH